jgi:formylglycine-generating enzyme required for sulfatase activity
MQMKTQMLCGGALLALALGAQGCAPARTLTLDLGGGVKMELVRIPAGEFVMGSPETEEGRVASEGPQHLVRIARPFYLGKYEVTGAQWQAVMGENPSWYPGDQLPVNKVSRVECQDYCQRLSERVGRTVRLPTEAEWEYACRAGSTTAFSFGPSHDDLGTYGWYTENSRREPNPVGEKAPNPWGLYDIYGNVWEWCEDRYHPSYEGAPTDGSAWISTDNSKAAYILRGGSWFNPWPQLRSAYRFRRQGGLRSGYIGLRVVVQPK